MLCQTEKNSCFGCCGHSYKEKALVMAAIDRNTEEFSIFTDLLRFRERAPKHELLYGVCRNVVLINGRVFCPLHPEKNNGQDLRIGHCNTSFMCSTMIEYNTWDESKRKAFRDFIDKRDFDIFSYSMAMDSESALREFKEQYL